MANVLNPSNYAAPSAQHASDRHYLWSGADTEIRTADFLFLVERSSDPADPPEGCAVIWQSDGTASGSDGDLLFKVTAGGVTKFGTLIDFSAVP